MIVRLMHEGQFRLADDVRDRLNDLDAKAVEAVDTGDETALADYLEQMWQLVRAEGEELPAESLETSDAVVPPADLTLEEMRALFTDEGLIPDLPA